MGVGGATEGTHGLATVWIGATPDDAVFAGAELDAGGLIAVDITALRLVGAGVAVASGAASAVEDGVQVLVTVVVVVAMEDVLPTGAGVRPLDSAWFGDDWLGFVVGDWLGLAAGD